MSISLSSHLLLSSSSSGLRSIDCPIRKSSWKEVGGEGCWSLSSAKPGNGIYELRDNNPNTFWQSDGPGPHTITIQFARVTRICRVDLLLNYKIDESYTPHVISIRLGNTENDLQFVKEVKYDVDVEDPPLGALWFPIELDAGDALGDLEDEQSPLSQNRNTEEEEAEVLEEVLQSCDYLEGFCLQIAVTANHQNGRDTHVRQIRIYGPSKRMGRNAEEEGGEVGGRRRGGNDENEEE